VRYVSQFEEPVDSSFEAEALQQDVDSFPSVLDGSLGGLAEQLLELG
jgi:hypothetical protein